LGEALIGLRHHHERAGSSDHVVEVIFLQIGLERQDRQPVDANPGAQRIIARLPCRTAAIVGAVAGNVDDAPAARKPASGDQGDGLVDRTADRCAAAEQLPGGGFDGIGDRPQRGGAVYAHPRHHLNLQRRTRPLHHGDGDRPGRTRAYRLGQPGIAKGGGIAALLQHEALLADAARGVDGEHELQIDGPLRAGW
jgi:hypothetical protein